MHSISSVRMNIFIHVLREIDKQTHRQKTGKEQMCVCVCVSARKKEK